MNTSAIRKKNIAIFASGTGTNAAKIIDYFKGTDLAAVRLIVCNRKGAGVLKVAEAAGIPSLLIEKKAFESNGYLDELRESKIDFIVLAGFLWKVPSVLIDAYPRRIINIHPALLPKYGGQGMYGQYVHESVINAGEMETGITIHYVDEHYDNGDIIFQTACPILDYDTPATLANRIHEMEHLHYPMIIEQELLKTS
jgi:phosphoribosylglycinamide formyltransferase 1